MDSMFYPVFHQVQCEWALAQGDLAKARRYAEVLCRVAGMPPERTYLALGHRFLAEIAMKEHDWDEARSEIAAALKIVTVAEVPLAAWQVYATAVILAEARGHPAKASNYRTRAGHVLRLMANSLDGHDPLRAALAAIPIGR